MAAQVIKISKTFKNILSGISDKQERNGWKNLFLSAERDVQSKEYKGKFVMNYDVSPNALENPNKGNGRKKKERIRPEDNTQLKVV